MVTVKSRAGEPFEDLLKRFKKAVENSGILSDFRRNEQYEKPSVKRKRKQAASRKRAIRQAKRLDKKRFNTSKAPGWRWNKDHSKKIPTKPYTGPRKTYNNNARKPHNRNRNG